MQLHLRAGADSTARSRYRNTPLQHAVYAGEGEVARVLLEKGTPIETRNEVRKSALNAATFQGNAELADTLVGYGASGASTSRLGLVMAGGRWLRRQKGEEWEVGEEVYGR